ncbi:hypothetical protein HCUR_00156 [Holospora curviuscula]|uniref:Uncharacterized protein n=1 Tax=Holospora curviuscula TaxID=1082868 RepID=A0A2S5REH9_9PROT|nr:hypothetical protein HCUR_00156 [Holospora curviuscula]
MTSILNYFLHNFTLMERSVIHVNITALDIPNLSETLLHESPSLAFIYVLFINIYASNPILFFFLTLVILFLDCVGYTFTLSLHNASNASQLG